MIKAASIPVAAPSLLELTDEREGIILVGSDRMAGRVIPEPRPRGPSSHAWVESGAALAR